MDRKSEIRERENRETGKEASTTIVTTNKNDNKEWGYVWHAYSRTNTHTHTCIYIQDT